MKLSEWLEDIIDADGMYMVDLVETELRRFIPAAKVPQMPKVSAGRMRSAETFKGYVAEHLPDHARLVSGANISLHICLAVLGYDPTREIFNRDASHRRCIRALQAVGL